MKKIRVYLRALEPNDYLKIHQWRQDKEISRNFGGVPLFSSSLNEQKWVESKIYDKENVSCAICIAGSDIFIGCIFLSEIDLHHRTGHMPVFIGDEKYWGKGLATDARVLLLKYAFYDRGLNRIWARVLEDNVRALKMLEKAGYQKEGVLRQSAFKDGILMNEIILSVLKEDFDGILNSYEF